jgi:hypothetical protein
LERNSTASISSVSSTTNSQTEALESRLESFIKKQEQLNENAAKNFQDFRVATTTNFAQINKSIENLEEKATITESSFGKLEALLSSCFAKIESQNQTTQALLLEKEKTGKRRQREKEKDEDMSET